MKKLFEEIQTLTDKLAKDASELLYQYKENAYDTGRGHQFEYLEDEDGRLVNEHGFTREEMETKVVDKNGNILTEIEVEEKRLLAECR